MAPGVTPSIRAACPRVAGRTAWSFSANLGGETAEREVVEVAGQKQALVAAERGDVGILAVEIAMIGGVDLDLLPRKTLATCRSGARCRRGGRG